MDRVIKNMRRIPFPYPKLTIFIYFLVSLTTTIIQAQDNLPKLVLPSSLGNYIALNYQQRQQKGIVQYMTFHDHNPQQLQGNPNLVAHQHQYYKPFTQSTESFGQLQLVGQYALNKRTMVRATVPYWQKRRIEERDFDQAITKKRTGIGDVWVEGKYQLFNSSFMQLNQKVQQIFWMGGGIKAPTGKDDQFDDLNELEPNFEVGTGSWDFLGSVDYWMNYQAFQIQASATYQYNGKSRYTYQFGNAIYGQVKMNYYWAWKNWIVQPQLQTTFYHKKVDEMNGRIIALDDTERMVCLGGMGGAIGYQHLKLSVQYQRPIWEQLVELQPATQQEWRVGLEYRF